MTHALRYVIIFDCTCGNMHGKMLFSFRAPFKTHLLSPLGRKVALLSTAPTLRATTGHVLNTFVRVFSECLKRLHRQIDNYVLLIMGLGHFRRSRINRYFLQEIKVLTRATTFLRMTDTF